MPERLVVIGGDAAGMSAASLARRRRSEAELEVIAFERSGFTSYSACGLPYYVAGEIDDVDQLIARSPEAHRANGIDLHDDVREHDRAVVVGGGYIGLELAEAMKKRGMTVTIVEAAPQPLEETI